MLEDSSAVFNCLTHEMFRRSAVSQFRCVAFHFTRDILPPHQMQARYALTRALCADSSALALENWQNVSATILRYSYYEYSFHVRMYWKSPFYHAKSYFFRGQNFVSFHKKLFQRKKFDISGCQVQKLQT